MYESKQIYREFITALNEAQALTMRAKQQTIKPEFLALALLKNPEGLIPRIIESLNESQLHYWADRK